MTLISLLMTWIVLRLWGSSSLLQNDAWFLKWVARLQRCERLTKTSGAVLFASVAGPLFLFALASVLLVVYVSPLAIIAINVPVLLYSFGRTNIAGKLHDYMAAWRRDDSAACVHILMELDGQLPAEVLLQDAQSWTQLHEQALRTFAFCGFERMFAVLFWFVLLGGAGALLYRLSSLYLQSLDSSTQERCLAAKWLWMLEWPAVRLLGLSWALVGNFVGCFDIWREYLFCVRKSSAQILLFSVQGALGLNASTAMSADEPEDSSVVCTQIGCSGHQLEALQSLFSRALLLWISVVALLTLFI